MAEIAYIDLQPLYEYALENVGDWATCPVPSDDADTATYHIALANARGFTADSTTVDGVLFLRVKCTDPALTSVVRQVVGDWIRSSDYDGTDFVTGDATQGWNAEGAGFEANDIRARGRFETDASGQRVVIDDDSVEFHFGGVAEATPGIIYADSDTSMGIISPTDNATATAAARVDLDAGSAPSSALVSVTGRLDLSASPTTSTEVGNRGYNDTRYAGTTSGQVRVSDGTTGAPAYSFSGDTDTGLYRYNVGADVWALSAGGTTTLQGTSTFNQSLVPLALTDATAATHAMNRQTSDARYAEINNGSAAEQSQVVVSGTAYYITSSNINLPATPAKGMIVGTRFTWRVVMSKTAAGTGTFALALYRGTNGTTADTQDVLQTIGTQTAVVDTLTVDVMLTVTATGATGSYYWTICPTQQAATATGFGVATGTTGLFSGNKAGVAMNTASLKFGLGFVATTGTPTIRIPLVAAEAFNIS